MASGAATTSSGSPPTVSLAHPGKDPYSRQPRPRTPTGLDPSFTPPTSSSGSAVDRGRAGRKHRLLVDGGGIPLAWALTGGNRNDVSQLLDLLNRVPPVRGRVRRPRRRPKTLLADRGYDHHKYRRLVWTRGIKPVIARRQTEHDSRARLASLGRRAHLRLAPRPPPARPHRPPRRHPRRLPRPACCLICCRRLETSLS